jgi:putative membrane protein
MDILIPYLHFIGIMTLMGALIAEHLLLKPGLNKEQINQLALVDLVYAVSVVIVLTTGLLQWFVYGKDSAYYLSNPIFHIKLTLFIILGILSIMPTIKFLRWRKQFKAGTVPENMDKYVKRLLMYLRLELLIVAIIPLLGVMTAMGFRF